MKIIDFSLYGVERRERLGAEAFLWWMLPVLNPACRFNGKLQ
jgi:hypothetical protein